MLLYYFQILLCYFNLPHLNNDFSNHNFHFSSKYAFAKSLPNQHYKTLKTMLDLVLSNIASPIVSMYNNSIVSIDL